MPSLDDLEQAAAMTAPEVNNTPLLETYLLLARTRVDAERFATFQLGGQKRAAGGWGGLDEVDGRARLWDAIYIVDTGDLDGLRHQRGKHHVTLLLLPGHERHLFTLSVQDWAKRHKVPTKEAVVEP